MSIQTTYASARENFSSLCNQVVADAETVIINRRGGKDVALISAMELSSLLETAHLLRSPKNAERLLTALKRAKAGKGKTQTVSDLAREVGLAQED